MPEYNYQIHSNIKNIAPILNELEAKWKGFGIDEKIIFQLRLSTEELIVNAIKHGNKSCEELLIKIVCRIFADKIELEIVDKGSGFDHASLPNPTAKENLEKRSGRGVFLVKQFMDKIEFLEGGRRIKIIKITDIRDISNTAEMPKEGKMIISKEVTGNITICKIDGEINIDNSYELRKTFEDLTKEGSRKVIVNFSALNYIDSSGLATLIEMFQRLKKIDGALRICSLNDKVKSVFEITKLNTLFPVYDSLESAQEGF
ncbi:MAG: anti-sigma factor antagonist [Candidatus Omnitrophica bacterium]|nr:anti-sigma factor antagonist [Candidatus Omnitrophota bacterium]